jgi:predicted ferric reductase
MKLWATILAVVALALAILLVWSPATPIVYRAGFLLGLAALVGWLLAPGGEMYVSLGDSNTVKRAAAVSVAVAAIMAPSLVLVEAGIAGYRGFVSFMRYVSVVVVVIGIAWLVLGFAIPIVLRRNSQRAK